ncbi:protein prune homolog 2-like isoform X3 [Asterias rubens]|uniref:protein prune homolog 2-like isoform X3 n=1 Tax=Asterias rubens TaxID=7604 RepID=UPI001454F80F|nr:protein prune homolog 2-like isoform X3 [Asterias rubens]
MEAFLRETKHLLESAQGDSRKNIHVVLGNESCDLDSAVSALVWAYHLSKQEETQHKWDVVVPVLNIPRHDFPLRTEVTHFLSTLNHDDSLVFRDDVNINNLHADGRLSLTLVDHNTLSRADAHLDAVVKEIIDHHSNNRHGDDEEEICVTIETVGSCCTLVAEKILAENCDVIDDGIAKLLLGPILVDTVNLSASAGKATAKDITMVEELSKLCPDLDKDKMYQELQEAKADISGFTSDEILRKDFKCVTGASMNIGMSSIPMNLNDFVEKPSVERDLHDFCSSKNLRLLVLMSLTLNQDDEAHRQISVYSSNTSDSMKDELLQTLDESSSPELILSELETDSPGVVVFSQGNVKASRKQVLPLVKDFLTSQENSSTADEEEQEDEVVTESDMSDINATLLRLSSNANNANDPLATDDPFDMGDNQGISSPDSSGIDAGSALLDLDLFQGNPNGMPTSESGTFSSADSAGTLGFTPSSPGSDAVGFGNDTEELLGLDPFGSGQPMDSATTPVPPSNPFEQSSSDDLFGLDAFMTQPVAASDPTPASFGDPVIHDYAADPFGVSITIDPEAQESESTSVTLSGNNPFGMDGETSSSDLLGLGTLTTSTDSESQPLSDPFSSIMEMTVHSSVSTTVESSSTDLGDFLNQHPGSPDQEVSKGENGQDAFFVTSSSSNPFPVSDESKNDSFGMDNFGFQTNEPKLEDGFPDPFGGTVVSTSSDVDFESVVMDTSGFGDDYQSGISEPGVVKEPVEEVSADPSPSFVAGLDEKEISSASNFDQDELDVQEGQPEMTPEITITETSDNEKVDSDVEYSDNFEEESPRDVNPEVEDEGFNENEEAEAAPSLEDEINEIWDEVKPDEEDDDDYEDEEDIREEDQEVDLVAAPGEKNSRTADEEDDAEATLSEENIVLDVAPESLAQAVPDVVGDSQENDVQSFLESEMEETEEQPTEAFIPEKYLQEVDDVVTEEEEQELQALQQAQLDVEHQAPEADIPGETLIGTENIVSPLIDQEVTEGPDNFEFKESEPSGSTEESVPEEMLFEDDQERSPVDRQDSLDQDGMTSDLQDQHSSREDEESPLSEPQPVEEVENVVATMIAQEMLDAQVSILDHQDTQEDQESIPAENLILESSFAENVQQDMVSVLGTGAEVDDKNQGEIEDKNVDQSLGDDSNDEVLDTNNVDLQVEFTHLKSDENAEDQDSAVEDSDVQPAMLGDNGGFSDLLQGGQESERRFSSPSDDAIGRTYPEEAEPLEQLDEDTQAPVDDVAPLESNEVPGDLPLDLVMEAESLERNISPISDDAQTRSSEITSPDSEFTSDVISEDPSSGDSYIVTDLSHDVTNFQIGDIKEEEEDQVTESTETTEVNLVDTTLEEKLDDFENHTNGDCDGSFTEEIPKDLEIGVIEDHFSEEPQVQKDEMERFSIPTEVGLCDSGRSSPKVTEQDNSAMQEEAHDLVEGVIKMAKYAYIEQLHQDQANLREVSTTEHGEEELSNASEDAWLVQRAEVAMQEHESVVLATEVLSNGDIVLEASSASQEESLLYPQKLNSDDDDQIISASLIQQEHSAPASVEVFGNSLLDEVTPDEQQEDANGVSSLNGDIEEPALEHQSEEILLATSLSVESTEPQDMKQTSDGLESSSYEAEDVLQPDEENYLHVEPVASVVEEEISQVAVPQEENCLPVEPRESVFEVESAEPLDMEHTREGLEASSSGVKDVLQLDEENEFPVEPVESVFEDKIAQVAVSQEENCLPVEPVESVFEVESAEPLNMEQTRESFESSTNEAEDVLQPDEEKDLPVEPVESVVEVESAEPLDLEQTREGLEASSSGFEDVLQPDEENEFPVEPVESVFEDKIAQVAVSQEESCLPVEPVESVFEVESAEPLNMEQTRESFESSTNEAEDVLQPDEEKDLPVEPVESVVEVESAEPLDLEQTREGLEASSSGFEDVLQPDEENEFPVEPVESVFEDKIAQVAVSQEESCLPVEPVESVVEVESTEPLDLEQTSEGPESSSYEAEDVLQPEEENDLPVEPVESVVEEEISQEENYEENDLPVEPVESVVEEEISQVVVSQEESPLMSSTADLEEEEVQDVSEPEVVAISEANTEQGVPLSTEENQKDTADEEPQSEIEVNIIINEEQGLQDVSSKSEESSLGKTKLIVEDDVRDVDIDVEREDKPAALYGLADILEYVDPDGNVEGSADSAVRPSTLSLPNKSTPKSHRLLSTGTPGSALSDTGTPLTPISMSSLDMLTPDTDDILDRSQDDVAEEGDSEKLAVPLAAKRPVSIDPDMAEDIHGEWDDKKRLMDDIVEKERRKSMTEKPTHHRELSVATAEAMKNMEGVTLPDEWQDDEFSQQKLAGVDSTQEEESFFRRKVPSTDGKLRTRDSMMSDDGSVEGMSAWAERLAGDDNFDEDEDGDLSPLQDDTLQRARADVEAIPEYTAKEEMEDRRNWRKVCIANKEFTVDMRAINPYKKVLSHGGYYGEGVNAIIVIASCYMPERSRKDYNYIMNNLFLYVISTLELLVAQEYMIVYFHGAAPKDRIPSLNWMRKCYQMIDRKLRKNLKGLFIVHPTTWLRTIVRFTRPFISSKFSKKLKFVENLEELSTMVTMEYVYVPDEVRRFDEERYEKDGGALWGWIRGRGRSGSESGSCYTMGPDYDTTHHDEEYIDEMLYCPTSRAARRRVSMQLRRGNFALSALSKERAKDFEDFDSSDYIEDDMFGDIEDDGDEEGGEEDEEEETDGGENNLKDEDTVEDVRCHDLHQDLEYDEEFHPLPRYHPGEQHRHYLHHPLETVDLEETRRTPSGTHIQRHKRKQSGKR